MQSAFGLLIIAINSVRLGFETMIYFTFEGLHMIRPGRLAQLRYYPTGVDPSEPEVDRYTTELRDTMERKDIPYVEDMLEMAQLEGVQFLACKTSADLFELGPEDFIDGVEIMLAADFMKKATGSDLHLMF
jgi:peroxiredoxin family protein